MAQTKTTLKKFLGNWSWFDTMSGFFFGLAVTMLMVLSYKMSSADLNLSTILLMQRQYWMATLKLFGAVFFFSRCWEIAKAPRANAVDLSKLTAWGFLHSNFVSIFAGMIALVFALSLAPEALELTEIF